ncbi:MAG: hypothetical protein ACTS4V_00190 [Candidatus Hodgkinia cicadicola]
MLKLSRSNERAPFVKKRLVAPQTLNEATKHKLFNIPSFVW